MMTKTETTEARERPVELVEQLRDAGVENSLASKVLECIDTERAKAARLGLGWTFRQCLSAAKERKAYARIAA